VVTEHGGVVMHGRSDATLNPGGVRIGTAELYRQVEQLEEIEDSVVVGQKWDNDVRVILFVKLAPGVELTDDLKNMIRRPSRACLAAPCARQDHPGAGHPLHPEHEKGGTGREEGDPQPGGQEQGCPEKSRGTGLLCRDC
jgi:hypothetical protein